MMQCGILTCAQKLTSRELNQPSWNQEAEKVVMLLDSETCLVKKENETALQWAEMRMIR